MIQVYNLTKVKTANYLDQWDSGFIYSFLTGDLWKTPDWENFEIINVDEIPNNIGKAIVLIPARHYVGLEDWLNNELKKIKRPILICGGDEEADFNADLIEHPNIHIWVQNPHIGTHDKYNKLGTGFTTHTRALLKNTEAPITKPLNIYFSGQVTHQRRFELVEALEGIEEQYVDVIINRTRSFTGGETKEEYIKNMKACKIAPCPSGAIIPDSFRLFEALECMAVPIADNKTPAGETMEYWDWLFGSEVPFYKVVNWDRLFELVPDILQDYKPMQHQITAWWINYKRDFAYKVMGQLNDN